MSGQHLAYFHPVPSKLLLSFSYYILPHLSQQPTILIECQMKLCGWHLLLLYSLTYTVYVLICSLAHFHLLKITNEVFTCGQSCESVNNVHVSDKVACIDGVHCQSLSNDHRETFIPAGMVPLHPHLIDGGPARHFNSAL